jgi:glutaredoxin
MKKLLLIVGVFALALFSLFCFAKETRAEDTVITEDTPTLIESPVAASVFDTLETDKYYLFIKTGCQYCEQVEKFMKANDIENSLNIEVYNVYEDTSKSELLGEICNEAGVSQSVPTLVINGQVYQDSSTIIAIFKSLGYATEPIDWEKWILIGLLGIAGGTVVVLIFSSMLKKK